MADLEVPEQVDQMSDSSDKSTQAQTQNVEPDSRAPDNIHQGEHVPDASKTETEPKHSAGTNESVIDDLVTSDANEQQPEETAEDARLGSSDHLSSQPDVVLTEATAQTAIDVGANATANVSTQTSPSAASNTVVRGTGTEDKTGTANTTAGETINGNATMADTSATELGLETEIETEAEVEIEVETEIETEAEAEAEAEAEISAEALESETTELTSDFTETVAPPEAISDFIVTEPIVEVALDIPTAELGPTTDIQRGPRIERDNDSAHERIELAVDPPEPALVIPKISTLDLSALEDQSISLDINLVGENNANTLKITISGVPEDATLSAGAEINPGVWRMSAKQLDDLRLHLPDDFSGEFKLDVDLTGVRGSSVESSTNSFSVDVQGVADAPNLIVKAVSGTEDQAVNLNISAALSDPSEILSVEVSQLPTGATLSAGTEIDGVWTLTGSELEGLQLNLPANLSGEFNLAVKATSSEGASALSVDKFLQVNVDAQADAPTLSISPAIGTEDQAVDLNINAALGDVSETLTVTIADVPTGATLSAGENNGDGTWTLNGVDLAGLQLNLPTHYSGSIDLLVTATSTESVNESASVNKVLGVTR